MSVGEKRESEREKRESERESKAREGTKREGDRKKNQKRGCLRIMYLFHTHGIQRDQIFLISRG